MKKIITLASVILAAGLTLISCKKDGPDPVVAETAIKTISAQLVTEEAEPLKIDGFVGRDSVIFVVPDGTSLEKDFTLTYTLTDKCSLYVNEALAESGQTKAKLSKTTKLTVKNENGDTKTYYIAPRTSFNPEVKLSSAIFKAADNTDLTADCIGDITDGKIVMSLPEGVKGKTLKLTLDVNDECVIELDGKAVEGKVADIDTSFPVTITIRNTDSAKTMQYTMTYCTSVYTWKKVGQFSNAAVDNFFAMTIDEVTREPYFALQEKDADGIAKASVLKFSNGEFVKVGSPSFTSTKATNICIASANGVPYIFYAESSSKLGSVMKYGASGWEVIGDAVGQKTAGTSYYPTSLCLDAQGNPIIALTTNVSVEGAYTKREPIARMYDGSAWSNFVKMPDRPMVGTAVMYGYTPRMVKDPAGVHLLVANQNVRTFSLYKYASSVWTTEIASFGFEGATESGTNNLDIEYNGKGLYAAINDNTGHNWQCSIHKLAEGKAEQVGNCIPVYLDNKYDQFDLTSDSEGNLIVATLSQAGTQAKVFSVDPETKAWVGTDLGESSGTYLGAGRGVDGKIYVSFFTKNSDGVYTLNLYEGTK